MIAIDVITLNATTSLIASRKVQQQNMDKTTW